MAYAGDDKKDEAEEEKTPVIALKDGRYRAKARGYVADVRVEVKVKKGKLVDVRVRKHRENRPKTAIREIPRQIEKAGGVEGVHVVTGATITSRAILKATGEALEKAGVKEKVKD